MVQEVMKLMVEALEERFDGDVVCVQPSEEEYAFMLGVDDSVMYVDPSKKEFTPIKRGDSSKYLDLKKFLKGVKLQYRSRSVN